MRNRRPGGTEIYADLVRLHTTLDLTLQEIHDEGLKRMTAVRRQIDRAMQEADFTGSSGQFIAELEKDPVWGARAADQIGDVFRRYIDRIAPHLDRYFDFRPAAPHGVRALPDALAGSSTFGHYEPPSSAEPFGLYRFNARCPALAPGRCQYRCATASLSRVS